MATVESKCQSKSRKGIQQERHGRRSDPEYQVWLSMKGRCANPRNKRYCLYGKRGITVCDAWMSSYATFIKDMGRRPGSGREWTLERKNNDLGYSPGNCEWASIAVQSRNKRNNRYYEYKGERKILRDFATQYGISYAVLKSRVRTYGWSIDRAIECHDGSRTTSRWLEYKGERLPMANLARKHGLDPRTLATRLRKGMSVADAIETPLRRRD